MDPMTGGKQDPKQFIPPDLKDYYEEGDKKKQENFTKSYPGLDKVSDIIHTSSVDMTLYQESLNGAPKFPDKKSIDGLNSDVFHNMVDIGESLQNDPLKFLLGGYVDKFFSSEVDASKPGTTLKAVSGSGFTELNRIVQDIEDGGEEKLPKPLENKNVSEISDALAVTVRDFLKEVGIKRDKDDQSYPGKTVESFFNDTKTTEKTTETNLVKESSKTEVTKINEVNPTKETPPSAQPASETPAPSAEVLAFREAKAKQDRAEEIALGISGSSKKEKTSSVKAEPTTPPAPPAPPAPVTNVSNTTNVTEGSTTTIQSNPPAAPAAAETATNEPVAIAESTSAVTPPVEEKGEPEATSETNPVTGVGTPMSTEELEEIDPLQAMIQKLKGEPLGTTGNKSEGVKTGTTEAVPVAKVVKEASPSISVPAPKAKEEEAETPSEQPEASTGALSGQGTESSESGSEEEPAESTGGKESGGSTEGGEGKTSGSDEILGRIEALMQELVTTMKGPILTINGKVDYS